MSESLDGRRPSLADIALAVLFIALVVAGALLLDFRPTPTWVVPSSSPTD